MTSKNYFFYPLFLGWDTPDSGFGFFCALMSITVSISNTSERQNVANLWSVWVLNIKIRCHHTWLVACKTKKFLENRHWRNQYKYIYKLPRRVFIVYKFYKLQWLLWRTRWEATLDLYQILSSYNYNELIINEDETSINISDRFQGTKTYRT